MGTEEREKERGNKKGVVIVNSRYMHVNLPMAVVHTISYTKQTHNINRGPNNTPNRNPYLT